MDILFYIRGYQILMCFTITIGLVKKTKMPITRKEAQPGIYLFMALEIITSTRAGTKVILFTAVSKGLSTVSSKVNTSKIFFSCLSLGSL